jgi:uncharacterized membrane protein SirB2
MKINTQRPWITPAVIGSFTLLSVTGILMFFHLDSGLNKVAHEWMSWIFVGVVVMHILLNSIAFKRYFKTAVGKAVIFGFLVLLALSFVRMGSGDSKPPFIAPVQMMAAAPLSAVAQVAQLDVAEVTARLAARGITAHSPVQSVKDLVGSDLGAQMRALSAIAEPAVK